MHRQLNDIHDNDRERARSIIKNLFKNKKIMLQNPYFCKVPKEEDVLDLPSRVLFNIAQISEDDINVLDNENEFYQELQKIKHKNEQRYDSKIRAFPNHEEMMKRVKSQIERKQQQKQRKNSNMNQTQFIPKQISTIQDSILPLQKHKRNITFSEPYIEKKSTVRTEEFRDTFQSGKLITLLDNQQQFSEDFSQQNNLKGLKHLQRKFLEQKIRANLIRTSFSTKDKIILGERKKEMRQSGILQENKNQKKVSQLLAKYLTKYLNDGEVS
ncbi:UNKNOWN [Stylonychia lemnae]|uniref:Uncharacterized protein n=1 Tax=Stylonychia lemnae TaxID=5949 RepID=A0A078A3I3_STYLE|nr:UNKNOWN [Stylonychia lemnae]|eukprot:CDW76078.1 UNKNOWN [Stylonychia lemnae]